LADVFAAFIGQVTQRAKSQADHLFKEGIEFAQGRDMGDRTTEEFDVPLEGALRWDELTNSMSELQVVDGPLVEPATNGIQNERKGIVPRRTVLQERFHGKISTCLKHLHV